MYKNKKVGKTENENKEENKIIYFKIRLIVSVRSVSANTNPALLNLLGTANWPPTQQKNYKMILKKLKINKTKKNEFYCQKNICKKTMIRW